MIVDFLKVVYTPFCIARADTSKIGVCRCRARVVLRYKTTEFIAYVVSVVAVLIASAVVDGNGDNGSGSDYFRADRAWLYVVLLTIGYMVSCGLAKSGHRDSSDS